MARKPVRRRHRRKVSDAKSFTLAVEAWVANSGEAALEVAREAAWALAEESREPLGAGGPMPVVTGNLRNSMLASTSRMPRIEFKAREKYPEADAQIYEVTSTAEAGQTIYLGYRAPYAAKVEEKAGFVRLPAQRWQGIVADVIHRIRGGG
jgi:hypothetical protein